MNVAELTAVQYCFFMAFAECFFYGITDFLWQQCRRCYLNHGKCRDHKHYGLHLYMDKENQKRAYFSFDDMKKQHIIHHFEQELCMNWKNDYEFSKGISSKIPVGECFYITHPHMFSWEYLMDNKDTLDFFIETVYKAHVDRCGSILNLVNTFHDDFPDLKNVHSLLNHVTETLDLPLINRTTLISHST